MYDRFGYPGLFAAYNAGPARYAAFLSGRRTLPNETRAYVATVGRMSRGSQPVRRAAVAAIFAVRPATQASTVAAPLPAAATALFVPLSNAPGR
jgi:hypothetical protein